MTPPEQPPRPRLRGNVHYLETDFATRLRQLVIWEARQQARQAVIRRIKAEGKVRVSLMSASEITHLAKRALAGACGGVAGASRGVRRCADMLSWHRPASRAKFTAYSKRRLRARMTFRERRRVVGEWPLRRALG
jgi:hypothetical protein